MLAGSGSAAFRHGENESWSDLTAQRAPEPSGECAPAGTHKHTITSMLSFKWSLMRSCVHSFLKPKRQHSVEATNRGKTNVCVVAAGRQVVQWKLHHHTLSPKLSGSYTAATSCPSTPFLDAFQRTSKTLNIPYKSFYLKLS